MATPLPEPDPHAWAFALQLAGDVRLLEVRADGSVWIRNTPRPERKPRPARPAPAPTTPAAPAAWRGTTVLAAGPTWAPVVPDVSFETVRVGRTTHLARAGHTVCGVILSAAHWASGGRITCTTCTTVLPPEA